MSSAVGPKVDCSRKRTVSALEGCASTRCTLMTAKTSNRWRDHKTIRPTRNLRVFMVTPPTVWPPQRGRLWGHARRQGVRGDGTVVITTIPDFQKVFTDLGEADLGRRVAPLRQRGEPLADHLFVSIPHPYDQVEVGW